MSSVERQQIIAGLLQCPEFHLLLQEHIHKFKLAEQTVQNEQNCMAVTHLVHQITDNLGIIVQHTVKKTIHQEYADFLNDNSRLQKEFEQLKQKVLRLSIRVPQEEISAIKSFNPQPICWSSDRVAAEMDSFDEQLEQDRMFGDRPSRSEFPEVKKLKKELDDVKEKMGRMANNSILQLVEQNNENVHRIIENNYMKLNNALRKDLQKMNQSILERSIQSALDIRSEQLQSRLNDTATAQRQLQNRLKQLESNIMSKYEGSLQYNQVSLKSVWNVITKIQADLHERTSIEGRDSDRFMKSPQSPVSSKLHTEGDEITQMPTKKKLAKGLFNWGRR